MSQITTHILDTARGRPAAGITLALHERVGDDWQQLASGITNDDGRVPELLPQGSILKAGTYCMHFATGDYFEGQGGTAFYPWVDVVFDLSGSGEHYHIPLLLSPYGYSTYRGS